MRPIRLTLPGQFWDSFVYKGRLYLFQRDGVILTLDWDRLIRTWPLGEGLTLPLTCAFARSDYLYGDRWSLFFSDPEVKQVVIGRFESLAGRDLVLAPTLSASSMIGQQDNPFPFPHADLTIYDSQVFIASTSGVFRGSCARGTQLPISKRPKKASDISAVSVAASYGSLALAAGDDGLFELPVSRQQSTQVMDADRLHSSNATGCSWLYQSIFASSHHGGGFLAAFSRSQKTDSPDDYEEIELADPPRRGRTQFVRHFDRVISENEIFSAAGYSWGNHDKIYLASDHRVSVVKYQPWEPDPLVSLGHVPLADWKGAIVSGGVAVFGTVIECENAIVMLMSDGSRLTIPGEPIAWRIFPRSRHYENQLHIIYEDRLEINSFNHDYFVNQEDKLAGTKYAKRENGTFRAKRRW